MNDNRKVIRYTVVKNDFKTLYSGEVKSRYDSNILRDSRENIVPGDRDDFYFRAEWSYDPDFLESRNYGSIHHVKLKEQQSETVFSHKDTSINSLFLNKNSKRLYATMAPIWTPDQGEAKVKIHKIWHPQGGKFMLGLTDDLTRPGTVQTMGESVAVTVTP
ncbi:hypothetical protein [Pantoea phytobeneficialis]|nr:hypothetical protein [Pantoea phytobeneficialis]MDO6405674.1 hypothetical protein [Pantoea phytobeneficialis]